MLGFRNGSCNFKFIDNSNVRMAKEIKMKKKLLDNSLKAGFSFVVLALKTGSGCKNEAVDFLTSVTQLNPITWANIEGYLFQRSALLSKGATAT